tara:strand:- start:343 stop:489 length:147 start_codon:yes stop_codon:yes gene_type:complete
MATPIYNIPRRKGGDVYNISNIYPIEAAPLFTPLFRGPCPPVRIPSYI